MSELSYSANIAGTSAHTTYSEPTHWAHSRRKRAFDLCGAIALQAVFAVPMIVVAAMVKLDSKGPAIFQQSRAGRDGRSFTLYKFRSMKNDACDFSGNGTVAQKNDDRVTRSGKFLRRSHLDELPQLWNVMKGDMSLVGPRPLAEMSLRTMRNMEGYATRTQVRPGLTCNAQVNGLRERERIVALDKDYVENATLLTDISLLCKTAYRMICPHENFY